MKNFFHTFEKMWPKIGHNWTMGTIELLPKVIELLNLLGTTEIRTLKQGFRKFSLKLTHDFIFFQKKFLKKLHG